MSCPERETSSCESQFSCGAKICLSLQITAKMCVVMVSGLRVTEGLLLFGIESLLLCEGFTLSPNGDVCCRRHHPSRYSNSVCAAVTANIIIFITAQLC